MSNQPKAEDVPGLAVDGQQEGSPIVAAGWGDMIKERYRKIKEHAETYPYVWGSYILVYGGFGLWFTYRWRKLRQTEDRVRALQEKLRKQVEAEQAANSTAATDQSANTTASANKPPLSADKAAK